MKSKQALKEGQLMSPPSVQWSILEESAKINMGKNLCQRALLQYRNLTLKNQTQHGSRTTLEKQALAGADYYSPHHG